MRVILGLLWLAVAGAAVAQEAPPLVADGERLAEVLPEELVSSLRRGAVGYLARTSDMIVSFGTDRGLTPDGIDWKVASDRADARADAQAVLLRADLDDDHRVSSAEIERLSSLQSEHLRGRMLLNFRAADANSDGTVDPAEREIYADRAALDRVPEEEVIELQATMVFDLNGDGYVVIDEVVTGVAALQALQVTKVKKEI